MIPFIQIGPLNIPTFFLVMSIAMSLAPFIGLRVCEKFKIKDQAKFLSMILNLTFFGLLGARLLHIIYEEPSYYLQNPMKVFYFWEGGLVFYGGLLLGFAYLAKQWFSGKISKSELDALALTMSPLYAIGRVGCYLNGCCFGTHCDLPFGIHRHPVQLYSTFAELVLFAYLLLSTRRRHPGATAMIWIAGHSAIRFILEFFRADPRGPEFLLSVSQWISLLLFAAAIFWLRRLNEKKGPTS